MLEVALLVLLGLALGAFGTLVGAGGGFMLVPVLLLLYADTEPEAITATSLFVVWVNSVSGTVAYWWQRRIDVKTGLIFGAAMLPSAVLGAIAVGHVSRGAFNVLVALALGGIGVSLLSRRGTALRAPVEGFGVAHRDITDRSGQRFVYRFRLRDGLALSGVIGFVSSLLGIGGGPLLVPAMALLLRFPVHIATATSQFVVAFMALEATMTHVASGTLLQPDVLPRAVSIACGALAGAQLGAHASRRVRGEIILRALGVVLMLVAVRLALLSL